MAELPEMTCVEMTTLWM